MKANIKTLNLISTISACVAVASAVSEIILITFSIVTPSKIETTIWIFGFLCWIGVYFLLQRQVNQYRNSNESILQEYGKLSNYCDRLLNIADGFCKINKEALAASEDILKRYSELVEVLSKIDDDKKITELINPDILSSYKKLTRFDNSK